jgi:hypothetical protein
MPRKTSVEESRDLPVRIPLLQRASLPQVCRLNQAGKSPALKLGQTIHVSAARQSDWGILMDIGVAESS